MATFLLVHGAGDTAWYAACTVDAVPAHGVTSRQRRVTEL